MIEWINLVSIVYATMYVIFGLGSVAAFQLGVILLAIREKKRTERAMMRIMGACSVLASVAMAVALAYPVINR